MKMLLFLIAITACTTVSKYSPIQTEVTKRDSRDRVRVFEMRASDGTCIAEVIYDNSTPKIYVLAISRTRLQNLGFRQILDGTEEGISNEVLMRNVDEVIRRYCLPLIINGYRAV